MKLEVTSFSNSDNTPISPAKISKIIRSSSEELELLFDYLIHVNNVDPERVLELVSQMREQVESLKGSLERFDILLNTVFQPK